jgi:hypothetical protein
MRPVTMTVFSTLRFARFWAKGCAWALGLLLLALAAGGVRAQARALEITQLQVERRADGLFLSSQVRMELPPAVEDALNKGVALFFVAEAEVLRERWYWYDAKVATAAKHMRLAYQPLTRRWRLIVSPEPISPIGLGMSFGQNFDSLDEALRAVERISGWKIADASAVDPADRHVVEFRFRLDMTQLPRPFQIGIVGQSDWNLSAARRVRLSAEDAR